MTCDYTLNSDPSFEICELALMKLNNFSKGYSFERVYYVEGDSNKRFSDARPTGLVEAWVDLELTQAID